MANALIIDTPELGACDAALEILGDCTSLLFSDAAELCRTHLCRGVVQRSSNDKVPFNLHSARNSPPNSKNQNINDLACSNSPPQCNRVVYLEIVGMRT